MVQPDSHLQLDLNIGLHELVLLDDYQCECYAATSAHLAYGNRLNPLYQPFVDQERCQQGAPVPQWPGEAPFAVCLTHDVDSVSAHAFRIHARRLLSSWRDARRSRDPRAWRTLQASLLKLTRGVVPRRRDPLHCYERWLQCEQEVGAHSTFLFLPERYGQNHYSNGGYRYDDRIRFDGSRCTVGEMMRELHQRGFEVGLHASWWSYNDAVEMRQQKEQIEETIDAPVVSVRQHNLHFDIRRTPAVQAAAGLRIDSSMGFNDNVGFRNGTAYPHLLTDPQTGHAHELLELPLIVQDKGLFRYLAGGSSELALDWMQLLIDRVRGVSGVLTLLWHPGLIAQPAYFELYRRILHRLADAGAWFGTMRDIDNWWRTRQQQIRYRRAG